MFPIVLGEIFGVFVDTLPANPKYPVEHYENMRLPIQMQLSEKRKAFSQFFVSFLESTSNFKHLKKKMMAIANVFPKFQTVKILVRPLSKNCGLRKRFDSQHEKVSQILAKSPGEQFFHLFSVF